jgi:hypothetical protein
MIGTRIDHELPWRRRRERKRSAREEEDCGETYRTRAGRRSTGGAASPEVADVEGAWNGVGAGRGRKASTSALRLISSHACSGMTYSLT